MEREEGEESDSQTMRIRKTGVGPYSTNSSRINQRTSSAFFSSDGLSPVPVISFMKCTWLFSLIQKLFQESPSISVFFSPFTDLYFPRYYEYCWLWDPLQTIEFQQLQFNEFLRDMTMKCTNCTSQPTRSMKERGKTRTFSFWVACRGKSPSRARATPCQKVTKASKRNHSSNVAPR